MCMHVRTPATSFFKVLIFLLFYLATLVFTAAGGSSLVAASGGSSLVAVCGLPIAAVSLVAK